jgi:hypothetical protein
MRIYDEDNNRTIKRATLLLTEHEARELLDGLRSLLKNPSEHVHVADERYEHENTLAIYDANKVGHFHERIKQVIKEDV